MLIEQLVKYLAEVLNVTLTVRQWQKGERLPLFLRDSYLYYRAEIHGRKFLLMVDVGDESRPPSIIGKHVEQVRTKWDGDVVYVREQVNAYIRKRLIEAGIQFIVPGNQLYLPTLAIDLREYFRRKRTRIHTFTPATQALVLFWLYNEGGLGREQTTPTEMAHILGYTKMTMSRAFIEFDGALDEIFVAEKPGGAKKDIYPGRQLWERLQPYLRDPVIRRKYFLKKGVEGGFGLRAGLTGLAAYSILAEPEQEVYAVSQSEWKVLASRYEGAVLDRPDEQTVGVEVWSYPPRLFAEQGLQGVVDPLSLYLSLKESRDERVEMALEELLAGVQW
jgi:hypothetical protein